MLVLPLGQGHALQWKVRAAEEEHWAPGLLLHGMAMGQTQQFRGHVATGTPSSPLSDICRRLLILLLLTRDQKFLSSPIPKLLPKEKTSSKLVSIEHVSKASRMEILHTVCRQVQLSKGAALALCQGEFGPKISALG